MRSTSETHQARPERPHASRPPCSRPACSGARRRCSPSCGKSLRARDRRRPRRRPSSRPSSPSATSATSAWAIRASCSSPTSRRARAACATCRRCSGSRRFLYGSEDPGELVRQGVLTRQSLNRFLRSRRFLWTVRCHLHYLTGRAEDRLTFDLQPEIARRMGYRERNRVRAVERFMKRYYLVAKDVGALTRIFCAALEERQQRPSALLPAPLRLRPAQGSTASSSRATGSASAIRAVRARAGPHARAVPSRPGPRARHPPAGAGRGHAPAGADRPAGARGPGGEPAVPRHPVLAQGPGADADADERGRAARPLHPRFRPHRRADAAQPLPRLHGRRAHHPGRSASCRRSRTASSPTSCRSRPR